MTGSIFILGDEKIRKTARVRTRFIVLGLAFWTIGIVVRLVQLQIFSHTQAKNQVILQNEVKMKVLPDRGSIFDRDGHILAQIVPSQSVFYVPPSGIAIDERMAPVKKLIPLLGLNEAAVSAIRASLEKGGRFIYIKRKIDLETAERVKVLKLTGIFTQEEPKRIYPQGESAAHVLGGVNIDNNGVAGVELYYNASLRGKSGEQIILRDTFKRPYHVKQTLDPERGKDIHLTIDTTIQYIAQREIEKAVQENQAGWGVVIVSAPATGEILAMASAPSYDPNKFPPVDRNTLFDRAIRTQIEPGSTFKIVTAAAALENHRVATYDSFDCREGSIAFAGGAIRDHKPFGTLTFSEVIAESSNIGTVQIGRRVGVDLLYKTIKDFGFGQRTGIDLPAEERGQLHPPSEWSRRSLDSLSVGYEIGITAIQILQAVNIVANRGYLIPPRIVKIIDGRPAHPVADEPVPAQVISAQTAEKLIDVLERVVLEGTGTSAAIKGYAIAGKTGTSQKFDYVARKYSFSKHIASFVGFVPADKPVLSMVIILDEPKMNAYYGGLVAAPVFREIALRVLRYLHVYPSPGETAILAAARSKESGR